MYGVNTVRRALLVKTIVDEHYRAQSHKGCMADVYRNHVRKIYPMSIETFYRYMKIAVQIDGYVGNGGDRVYRETRAEACRCGGQLSLF